MSEVVDLLQRIAKKKKDKASEKYYDSHDDVLDLCEDLFPEGAVIIAVDNDEIQVSSTIEDSEEVQVLLFSALKSIQEALDDDKLD